MTPFINNDCGRASCLSTNGCDHFPKLWQYKSDGDVERTHYLTRHDLNEPCGVARIDFSSRAAAIGWMDNLNTEIYKVGESL